MHIHPHGQNSERVGVSPREYSDGCGMPCVRPPLVYVHYCEHEKARRRARRDSRNHGLTLGLSDICTFCGLRMGLDSVVCVQGLVSLAGLCSVRLPLQSFILRYVNAGFRCGLIEARLAPPHDLRHDRRAQLRPARRRSRASSIAQSLQRRAHDWSQGEPQTARPLQRTVRWCCSCACPGS
jgi:hypothetical protein